MDRKKAAHKGYLTAAIVALVVLAVAGWLTNYALSTSGSIWWLLLSYPILLIGIFFLAIGPTIKPIRIFFVLLAIASVFMFFIGLLCFPYPWDSLTLGFSLESIFIGIVCIVLCASAEGDYERYKRALAADEEKAEEERNAYSRREDDLLKELDKAVNAKSDD